MWQVRGKGRVFFTRACLCRHLRAYVYITLSFFGSFFLHVSEVMYFGCTRSTPSSAECSLAPHEAGFILEHLEGSAGISERAGRMPVVGWDRSLLVHWTGKKERKEEGEEMYVHSSLSALTLQIGILRRSMRQMGRETEVEFRVGFASGSR